MAGAGDLANIENIRRDEKNSIVGDTLHMVGTLRDPTVGKINCCCLGRALKKTTFRGHVPYQGWVDPLPLKKKSTFFRHKLFSMSRKTFLLTQSFVLSPQL